MCFLSYPLSLVLLSVCLRRRWLSSWSLLSRIKQKRRRIVEVDRLSLTSRLVKLILHILMIFVLRRRWKRVYLLSQQMRRMTRSSYWLVHIVHVVLLARCLSAIFGWFVSSCCSWGRHNTLRSSYLTKMACILFIHLLLLHIAAVIIVIMLIGRSNRASRSSHTRTITLRIESRTESHSVLTVRSVYMRSFNKIATYRFISLCNTNRILCSNRLLIGLAISEIIMHQNPTLIFYSSRLLVRCWQVNVVVCNGTVLLIQVKLIMLLLELLLFHLLVLCESIFIFIWFFITFIQIVVCSISIRRGWNRLSRTVPTISMRRTQFGLQRLSLHIMVWTMFIIWNWSLDCYTRVHFLACSSFALFKFTECLCRNSVLIVTIGRWNVMSVIRWCTIMILLLISQIGTTFIHIGALRTFRFCVRFLLHCIMSRRMRYWSMRRPSSTNRIHV